MFFGIGILLTMLLPIALIGAVAAAVAAQRQAARDETPDERGIGTVRRLFLYALMLVSLVLAAVGLSMLLGGAVDAAAGEMLLADRREAMSGALALTVVGAPAWVIFMLLAQRSLAEHPVEQRAQARWLYLGVARGIALTVFALNATSAGRMLLGVEDLDGGAWGALLVWGGVWALHQRIASEGAPTSMARLLDRFYLYYGALLGLWVLVGGAFVALLAPLSAAYDEAFRDSIVRSAAWTEGLRTGAVLVLVGGAVWAWHWLARLVERDRLTTLWRVHVLLFGALGGVVLTLGPAAVLLYALLEWLVGQPGSTSAAEHFSLLPGAGTLLILGVATWLYHRVVLLEGDVDADRGGPERLYRVLLAGAGLITAAVGLATLVALAADVVGGGPEFIEPGGWWRNTLVRAVTLLAIGVPIWSRSWLDLQRAADGGGAEERAALARRGYLFAAVGVAVLALLVSLTVLLYGFFQDALEGTLTLTTLRDARWSIAVAVTAGVVAVYHFLVLREDQRALPATPAPSPVRRREVVVLAAPPAEALLVALAEVPGARVQLWPRLDASSSSPTPEELASLRAAVAASDAPRLAVIAGPSGLEVIALAGREQ